MPLRAYATAGLPGFILALHSEAFARSRRTNASIVNASREMTSAPGDDLGGESPELRDGLFSVLFSWRRHLGHGQKRRGNHHTSAWSLWWRRGC